jgi:hypothetical protein
MTIWCIFVMTFCTIESEMCRLSSALMLLLCVVPLTVPIMVFRGQTFQMFGLKVAINKV